MMRKVGDMWVCTLKRRGEAPVVAIASCRHIAWKACIDAVASL